MAAKKQPTKPAPAKPASSYHITGCNITAEAGRVSDQTAQAVSDIARAVEAASIALQGAAKALQGTQPGSIHHGIHIEDRHA